MKLYDPRTDPPHALAPIPASAYLLALAALLVLVMGWWM